MNAIFAIHKNGTRMLAGLKCSADEECEVLQQRIAVLKSLGYTDLEEKPLFETLNVKQLVDMADELFAVLRGKAEEPVVVHYSDDITLEVRPNDDDDRVLVSAEGRGDTVLNYTEDGLAIDVYAREELDAVMSTWICNSDLVGDAGNIPGLDTAAAASAVEEEESGSLWNHAFDFAFEVFSKDAEGADINGASLRKSLQKRLDSLSDADLEHACGCFDSHEH